MCAGTARQCHDDQVAQPAFLGQGQLRQADFFDQPAQMRVIGTVGDRFKGLVRPQAGLGSRVVERFEHGFHAVGGKGIAQEIAA